MRNAILLFTLLYFAGCGARHEDAPAPVVQLNAGFPGRWYAGTAEITGYELFQARYGEVHRGWAVLIFVTEDFSRRKNVKLDDPSAAGNDAVKVMKLNFTRSFRTGIYPYSMMLSSFTEIGADDRPLKLTATSQEWCGQTFTQLVRKDKDYRASLFSYFEAEGDQEILLQDALPEDALWTQMRIDPARLRTGSISFVPGLLQQRFLHSSLSPVRGFAIHEKVGAPDWLNAGKIVSRYVVHYPVEKRLLAVYHDPEFPFTIHGWLEYYPDPAGDQKPMMVTRAIRKKEVQTDYWNKRFNRHQAWSDSLGLMN